MTFKIQCPYCFKSMEITLSRSKAKDVICEFCGSPLGEEAMKAIKDYKPPSRTSEKPLHSDPPTKAASFPSYETPPAFPPPKQQETHRPIEPAKSFPFKVGAPKFPQKTLQKEACLIFPQIHQKIPIPASQSIFHFGRNIIIPLVSASKFDIEWLNSISRIQKQNRKVIRAHFSIRHDPSGKYFIADRNSRWGTWLNRKQIKDRGEISIMNGDKIELMLSKPDTKDVFPFEIQFQC
jgi:hypothetical protein